MLKTFGPFDLHFKQWLTLGLTDSGRRFAIKMSSSSRRMVLAVFVYAAKDWLRTSSVLRNHCIVEVQNLHIFQPLVFGIKLERRENSPMSWVLSSCRDFLAEYSLYESLWEFKWVRVQQLRHNELTIFNRDLLSEATWYSDTEKHESSKQQMSLTFSNSIKL